MHSVPSFFGTGRRGDDHSESESSMTPSLIPSSMNHRIASCSSGVRGHPNFFMGCASPTSMQCVHLHIGGNPTLSLNTTGTIFLTTSFKHLPYDFFIMPARGKVSTLPLLVSVDSASMGSSSCAQ